MTDKAVVYINLNWLDEIELDVLRHNSCRVSDYQIILPPVPMLELIRLARVGFNGMKNMAPSINIQFQASMLDPENKPKRKFSLYVFKKILKKWVRQWLGIDQEMRSIQSDLDSIMRKQLQQERQYPLKPSEFNEE